MKKLICGMILTGTAIFSLVIVTSVGCGSPGQLDHGVISDGGAGGGAAGSPTIPLDASTSGTGGSGGSGTSGPTPTSDANCGSQIENTSQEPADVLLVLDRSGSMEYSIAEDCYCSQAQAGRGGQVCSDTSNCSPRWQTLSSALGTTLSSTPDIHWGLKFFATAGQGECTVSSAVEVPIATGNADTIQAQINNTTPANHTPTFAAITAATAYLKTLTDANKKVILLATDGEPNCANNGKSQDTTDVQGTTDAISAASQAGFQTYVIGIGPSVGNLDNFAQAGGTNNYYPATSPQDLADALKAIVTTVASCIFTLSATPPDLKNVAVYLDKNLVQQDSTNGWSFGASSTTIVLNGSTCDKIKSGQASTVQVLFGCGGPPLQVIP